MNKAKKLLVSLMIFLCLFSSFPVSARAQYVDVANAVKEYALDLVAYYAANIVIKRVTAQTVNWINSGFKGNPAYVTDPKQFFLDTGDDVAAKFLSETAINKLCSPFKAQVRLALVRTYVTSNNNFSCTLSILKNNYEQFTTNFSAAGWSGWFELTQVDANNPYGAFLNAQNQMSIQVGQEQDKYQKQLNYGRGILSFERCKAGWTLSESDINSLGEAGKGYKVGDCYKKNYETVTPGSTIQDQLDKVLSTGQSRIEAADEIDEIISALLNQLINRVIGGIGKGLKGATEDGYTKSLASEKEPTPKSRSFGTHPPNCTFDQNSGQVTCEEQTCTVDENGNEDCTGGGGGGGGGGGTGTCSDVGGDGVNFTEAEWRAIIEGAEGPNPVTTAGLQSVLAAVQPHGGSVQHTSAGTLRSRVYLTVATDAESCSKPVDISSATCEDCGGSWVWVKRF